MLSSKRRDSDHVVAGFLRTAQQRQTYNVCPNENDDLFQLLIPKGMLSYISEETPEVASSFILISEESDLIK
jgi:hypothetical protein